MNKDTVTAVVKSDLQQKYGTNDELFVENIQGFSQLLLAASRKFLLQLNKQSYLLGKLQHIILELGLGEQK